MPDSLPWVRKHHPKSSAEIVGQNAALLRLKDFVENYRRQKKKALLLYGPTGCGKTSSVHAVASEMNLELLEINASDYRTAAEIETKVGSASGQMSLFGTGKLILIDEVDGISGQKDRGGIAALTKLLAGSAFPIIITANNPFNKKFSTLRKQTELVEYAPLEHKDVEAVLERVCRAEGVQYEAAALKTLALRSGSDLRGAMTDLQIMTAGKARLSRESLDELGERNRQESLQSALTKVLKSTDPAIVAGAFDAVDENVEQVLLWLDENVPREYTKPEDIARAYEALSLADVFYSRIRRWQYWRLLVYVYYFSSVGVAIAKDAKYRTLPQYRQPSRLLKMYIAKMRYQKRLHIAEKVAGETHSSRMDAVQATLPFLQAIFRAKKGAEIAEALELDAEEVAWLNR